MGAAGFVNSLDLPSLALLLGATLLLKGWFQREGEPGRRVTSALAFSLAVVVLAVILYLPFYLTFEPEGSFRPLEAAVQGNVVKPLELTVTFPHHLAYTWLPFLWLIVAFTSVALVGFRPSRSHVLVAAAPVALVSMVWVGAVLIGRGPDGFVDEIEARGVSLLSLAIVALMLVASLLALIGKLGREANSEAPGPPAFALLVAAVGLLLVFGIELFWIEAFPRAETRIWTAFHVNYLVWIFFSIAGAFCLYYLVSVWQPKRWLVRIARIMCLGAAAVILLAALVYPVTASFSFTRGFSGGQSLSALNSFKRFAPADYEGIEWLKSNADGSPVILEAVGESYTPFGRVSTITGLPTLLQWPAWHETQWRATADFVEPRTAAAELVYTTTDPEKARAVLDQFEVEYVYVGSLEREQYGEAGLSKFGTFMDVVFENAEVVIYKMR